jgi:hypothetical protein
MAIRASLALSLLCAGLAGCVPFPVQDRYHQVSVDEHSEGSCLEGKQGTPSRALDRGPVHIDVNGDDFIDFSPTDYMTDLRIRFHVPLGSIVVYDPRQVQVLDPRTGQPAYLRTHEMRVVFYKNNIFGRFLGMRGSREEIPETGDLEPDQQGLDRLVGEPVDYIDQLHFSVGPPGDFDVLFPAMKVDGTSYPASRVHFDHDHKVFCVLIPAG